MMKDKELIGTVGGIAKLNATMINALSRGVTVLYDLGRSIGTAFRMAFSGKRC